MGLESEQHNTENFSGIKNLLLLITESLVDNTSCIEINITEGNQTNIAELKVHQDDIGKVIGRQGRTADAIRTIMSCSAAKLNKKYILQIIDE